jgi:hypothetical protein
MLSVVLLSAVVLNVVLIIGLIDILHMYLSTVGAFVRLRRKFSSLNRMENEIFLPLLVPLINLFKK